MEDSKYQGLIGSRMSAAIMIAALSLSAVFHSEVIAGDDEKTGTIYRCHVENEDNGYLKIKKLGVDPKTLEQDDAIDWDSDADEMISILWKVFCGMDIHNKSIKLTSSIGSNIDLTVATSYQGEFRMARDNISICTLTISGGGRSSAADLRALSGDGSVRAMEYSGAGWIASDSDDGNLVAGHISMDRTIESWSGGSDKSTKRGVACVAR